MAPIVSYCLLAALIVSYWLLMAPLAPVVSYWLLLVPIRSYWLLLALYFAKKKTALPVHLLRQVFYGFHRFSRILIDLYGFHGFLGPEVGRPLATGLHRSRAPITTLCNLGTPTRTG